MLKLRGVPDVLLALGRGTEPSVDDSCPLFPLHFAVVVVDAKEHIGLVSEPRPYAYDRSRLGGIANLFFIPEDPSQSCWGQR